MGEVERGHLIGPWEKLDYFDRQSIDLPRAVGLLEAWNILMEKPWPGLKWAFRVRDAISARFGVKRIGGFSGQRKDAVVVGERLDFFLVEGVGPEALLLTERDRHLDVMTCISVKETRLSITSSVIVHNWFGHTYMIPVGPAHKVIVRTMLAQLQRTLAEEAGSVEHELGRSG